ncbi:hypothetical protein RD055328_03020 [Companilactobacillus sp. RD055328]|uniref:metallophosphoesterase n=1 Tax=Companilactobacillus sp. RD055328 TaxID=2916634 RepID=UPI001FC846CD|nr:metallophosphoesterase [Companilactobacillus sp. RD055328]GKQ42379.1 hypothetical protein RD055328_03020 [Companilactobacillus sp. RD055328]
MFKKISFFIVIIIIFIPIYSFAIEPFLVHTNHVTIGEDTKNEQLKVVQISDIQVSEAYGSDRLDKIVTRVNSENPDIIVFTGDLFDNYAKYSHETEIIQKLGEMKANLGKFAVWGNHDYGGGASRVYDYVMSQSGFKVLKNYGQTLTLTNGKKVFIGGLDDSLLGNPSVSDTLSYCGNPDYSILLTHEPDVADDFVGTDTQLVLAGHSHGGQIWIPFHPITNTLARKYVRGLYTLSDGTKLYVNTGLGTTSIHARFNVVPEVTSFDIRF